MAKKIKDPNEEQWEKDRDMFGWELPEKAHWVWRLPVIRYFRYLTIGLKIHRHANKWIKAGIGLCLHPYDEWVLYAIYRGWC